MGVMDMLVEVRKNFTLSSLWKERVNKNWVQ